MYRMSTAVVGSRSGPIDKDGLANEPPLRTTPGDPLPARGDLLLVGLVDAILYS